MFLRFVIDGGVLDDRSHPSAHRRHASRHHVPHVWNHEVIRCESLYLLAKFPFE